MSSLVNPRKQAIGMLGTRRQRSFSKSTFVKSRSKSLVLFERITFYLQVPFLLLLPLTLCLYWHIFWCKETEKGPTLTLSPCKPYSSAQELGRNGSYYAVRSRDTISTPWMNDYLLSINGKGAAQPGDYPKNRGQFLVPWQSIFKSWGGERGGLQSLYLEAFLYLI